MSIKEREWTNKDGSITRVWVSGYNDANGKWKTKQFNKKKDAQAHQDSVKTDVRKGIHIADSEGIPIEQPGRVGLDKCEAEGVTPRPLLAPGARDRRPVALRFILPP